MSSHYGTPQTEAHFLPDSLHLEISNFLDGSRLDGSRPARMEGFTHSHHGYNAGGLPSPPDSNTAAPSNASHLPLGLQPHSHLLLPHYLSFTTSIENNYLLWSTRMIMALIAAGTASHITHGLTEPLREAEFLTWLHHDEEVKRMIMSKLSDYALEKMLQTREKARSVLVGTGKRESAFGLWVYLGRAYGGAIRTDFR